MKALVGDYVRKDGAIVKVIEIDNSDPDCPGYLTDDGGCISDQELSYEDVLLPSEAIELLERK